MLVPADRREELRCRPQNASMGGACFYLQFVGQFVHLRKNKMLSTQAAVALVILECSFRNSHWYMKNRHINHPSLSCWLGAGSHLSQWGILEHLRILIASGQQHFHLASLNINSTAMKLLGACFSCFKCILSSFLLGTHVCAHCTCTARC